MAGPSAWDESCWLISFLSAYGSRKTYPNHSADWPTIMAAADRGLVIPRFAVELLKRPQDLPQDVSEYLTLTLELSCLRDAELRRQLTEIVRSLNANGIVPVVMKGSALLLDGSTSATGRVMLDLDLYIADPSEYGRAISTLHTLGYVASGPLEIAPKSHHFPPFFKEGALARVELHYLLSGQQHAITWDEAGARARLVDQERNGLRFRTLSAQDALRLAYLQCRWLNMSGYVILMKWLDFMDRCKALNITDVRDLQSIGFPTEGTALDKQIFSALQESAGFPYSGVKDNRLLKKWQRGYTEPTALRILKMIFRKIFDINGWKGKSTWDAIAALWKLATDVKTYLHRARNKDAF